MERGDNGPGRDAYGPPGRERGRRGYRPEGSRAHLPGDGYPAPADEAAGPDWPPEAGEDAYGQLLRRPGEVPPRPRRYRQPGRPNPGQPGRPNPGQPGRPNAGQPGRPNPGQPGRFAPGAGPPPAVPVPGGVPGNGVPGNGVPGGVPGHGVPGGVPGNGVPGHGVPGGVPGHGVPGARMPGGRAPRGAPGHGRPAANGGQLPRQQYPQPDGRRIPAAAERPYRPPAPGGPVPGGPVPGAPAPPPAGPRHVAFDGRERPGPPPEPPGPVIRQREAAVAGDPAGGPAQPAASIEPDGLEAFARDLRALRALANLDYPEMADVSHYEMKTLAAAAAGLRLPTFPVAVAFVRACGGNVTEWEERWQKLAGKITADAARKRRNDGDEQAGPSEPADAPAAAEPPASPAAAAAAAPGAEPGEVYVITSAKPRQPGW